MHIRRRTPQRENLHAAARRRQRPPCPQGVLDVAGNHCNIARDHRPLIAPDAKIHPASKHPNLADTCAQTEYGDANDYRGRSSRRRRIVLRQTRSPKSVNLRPPVRTSNFDVRFINEVVHRLSRAPVEPPVEQEPAVAGNLLAVLLREQASHRCLASTRLRSTPLRSI